MEKLVKSTLGQWKLKKALIPIGNGDFMDDETGEVTEANAGIVDRYSAPLDHRKAPPHPLTDSFSVKYSHSDPADTEGNQTHYLDVYHGNEKVGTRKAVTGNDIAPDVEGFIKQPNIPEQVSYSDSVTRHYLSNPDLWDDRDHHQAQKNVVKFNLDNGLHPLHDPVKLKLENAASKLETAGSHAIRNKPEQMN